MIAPGTHVGRYEIVAPLGAGGMGEVYRARDPQLGREVALKVVAGEAAPSSERRRRFEEEARAVAALRHPHILAIHDVGDHEGCPYLVLELLEGETLGERLARGPLPPRKAVELAIQVCSALAAAHASGIVHRDVKPDNILLAAEGAKLLDFGLAKLSQVAEDDSQQTATATVPGGWLGTPGYMSPEQLRGLPATARSDIFALGCVLYETLSGCPAFRGSTRADTLSATLEREPPAMTSAGAPLWPALERIVRRCLEKEPEDRFQSARDLAFALDAIAGTASGASLASERAGDGAPPPAAARRQPSRERLLWALLALSGFTLVGGIAWAHRGGPREHVHAARFTTELPRGWSVGEFAWPVPSPDGARIAYSASPSVDPNSGAIGQAMVWIRPLDSLEARPVAGTEGAGQGVPFWSPDGRSLGFFAAGELRQVSLTDGTVRRICALPSWISLGADWSQDGTILFSAGALDGRIYRVAATGGEPRPLTVLDASRGEKSHHMPRFLPDGRRFLFTVAAAAPEAAGLYLASIDAPAARQRVAAEWRHYEWSSGHLVSARNGTLFAQAFDATAGELTGEAVAIGSAVAHYAGASVLGRFGVAAGTVAAFTGDEGPPLTQLTWVDRKGRRLATVGAPGHYVQFALSPDERTIAVEIDKGLNRSDLWLMDIARGLATRFSEPGERSAYNPVWAPDGRSLAFSSESDGTVDVRRKGLTAGERETVVFDTPDRDYPECWSRDGKTLLFLRHTSDRKTAWAFPLGGGQPVQAVQTDGKSVDEPQLSPDGKRIAYMSDDSGAYEVYLEPFGRAGERERLSALGGGQPKWRGDGKELFYASPAGVLMSVSFHTTGNSVEVGQPTRLFEIPGMQPSGEYDEYAATRDGQRFLVKMPTQAEGGMKLEVITHWTSLLEGPGR